MAELIGKMKDWARALKRNVVALWFACKDPRTPPLAKALTGMALTLSPTRDHGALFFVEPWRADSSTKGRVWVVAFAFSARCAQADYRPCTGRSV